MRLNTRLALPAAALAGLLCLPAHAAGTVDVSFVSDPLEYTDAGRDRADAIRNEETLSRYLQSLGGRWLADDQQLKVHVVDLNLAGRVDPTRRGPRGDLRVALGSADIPVIHLRYTLSENGRVLAEGDETVSDPNYLRHAADIHRDEPLHDEKRVLADWFKARIVERKPAG